MLSKLIISLEFKSIYTPQTWKIKIFEIFLLCYPWKGHYRIPIFKLHVDRLKARLNHFVISPRWFSKSHGYYKEPCWNDCKRPATSLSDGFRNFVRTHDPRYMITSRENLMEGKIWMSAVQEWKKSLDGANSVVLTTDVDIKSHRGLFNHLIIDENWQMQAYVLETRRFSGQHLLRIKKSHWWMGHNRQFRLLSQIMMPTLLCTKQVKHIIHVLHTT